MYCKINRNQLEISILTFSQVYCKSLYLPFSKCIANLYTHLFPCVLEISILTFFQVYCKINRDQLEISILTFYQVYCKSLFLPFSKRIANLYTYLFPRVLQISILTFFQVYCKINRTQLEIVVEATYGLHQN